MISKVSPENTYLMNGYCLFNFEQSFLKQYFILIKKCKTNNIILIVYIIKLKHSARITHG